MTLRRFFRDARAGGAYRCSPRTPGRFFRDARAGATALVAAAVAVMTVGGTALIGDHVWLVDQRDALKAASDAAGVAATKEMVRLTDAQPNISDADLKVALEEVSKRYVKLNLEYLPADRLAQARNTLKVEVTPNRSLRTVDVLVMADLGGTVLSRHLPIAGNSVGPEKPMRAEAVVESVVNPIEAVLAIDVSISMGFDLEERFRNPASPASRISIVKRAASDLVDILEPDADRRIAVGLVPWHEAVRLDPDAATDWSSNGWARYPTQRRYGEPYMCSGSGCTPPPPVEQPLAPAAPEPWNGCLDSHRTGSAGTRASVPATSEFFTPPSSNPFAQRFFPACRARRTSACLSLRPRTCTGRSAFTARGTTGARTANTSPANPTADPSTAAPSKTPPSSR